MDVSEIELCGDSRGQGRGGCALALRGLGDIAGSSVCCLHGLHLWGFCVAEGFPQKLSLFV